MHGEGIICNFAAMKQDNYDSSASGYVTDAFEGISRRFTDIEVLHTSEVNVVARAKRYGRWWLLKGLRPEVAAEAAYQQRLRKELSVLMTLQHPGVTAAYGVEDVVPLGPCIVMDYVEGVTLDHWLHDGPTRKERRRATRELAEAVAYIHQMGIVHRDLKPTNIIVTRNGSNIRLIDFGLADGDSHALLKQPAGTPRYMAPEQERTAVADVRNDIYSLGLILQQMLPERRYRRATNRCLLPADKRYQNMAELQEALEQCDMRGRQLSVAALALLLAAIVGGVAILTVRQKAQNARLSEQQATIDAQQTTINGQQATIDGQQATISEQQATIDTQQTRMNQQRQQLSQLQEQADRKQAEEDARTAEEQKKKQEAERLRLRQRFIYTGTQALNEIDNTNYDDAQTRYLLGMQMIYILLNEKGKDLVKEEREYLDSILRAELNRLGKKWVMRDSLKKEYERRKKRQTQD